MRIGKVILLDLLLDLMMFAGDERMSSCMRSSLIYMLTRLRSWIAAVDDCLVLFMLKPNVHLNNK